MKLKLIKLIKQPEILLSLAVVILIALSFTFFLLSDESEADASDSDAVVSTVILMQMLKS